QGADAGGSGAWLSSVLTKAVHRCAQEKLDRNRDSRSRGWLRYNEWEQKKWKQQHYEYYDDELFRCCYAINKLPWSVGISAKSLEAVSNVEAVNRVLLSSQTGVCVGCGPGSDAIALLARRHHHSAGPAQPLVMFLVDRCGGWQPLISSIDEQLREQRLPYSLWFKAGCVRNAADAAKLLPDADLVVLSFAHSVNAEPDLWPHLAARYKLVLVIDITSEALADALQRVGFTACQIESQSAVSIFYCLAGSQPVSAAGDAGSQPVSAAGDAGSQPVSAAGDAGSQPVSEAGDAGSQPVSAAGDAGSQPVSAAGDAGSQPVSAAGDAGSQPVSAAGDAGSQPVSAAGDAGSQPVSAAGDAGSQPVSAAEEAVSDSNLSGLSKLCVCAEV
ncbi:hypothetical protein BOX15_Mlig033321g1, partial [Macrostomum lignano]